MAVGDTLGRAVVHIEADKRAFERALKNIDAEGAEKARETGRRFAKTLEAEIDKADLNPNLGLDTKKAKAELEKFKNAIGDIDVDLDLKKYENLRLSATAVVDEVKNFTKEIKLKADISKESLNHVDHKLDKVANDNRTAKFDVEVNSGSNALAKANLAWTTRARKVEIYPEISPLAATKIAGLMGALSGTRAISDSLSNVFEKLRNLDRAIPSVTKAAIAVGGLGNAILAGVGNIGALATDVTKLGGALLPLPGIIGGLGTGLAISIVGFKDISNQVPAVQRAFAGLGNTIRENFWSDSLRGSLATLANNIGSSFETGLGQASRAAGNFFTQFSSSLSNAFKPQVVNEMMYNLAQSFNISSRHADSFANIISRLGSVGSNQLPRLANWFGQVADRMSAWLTTASESGRINQIIDNALSKASALGRGLVSLGGIIGQIGHIAQQSGAASLEGMAAALDKFNKKLHEGNIEVALGTVFSSVHTAFGKLTAEIGPSASAFGKSLVSNITYALDSLGPAVGKVFNGLFTGLSTQHFSDSFKGFISGISNGLSGASQYIPSIVQGFGAVARVAGALAENTLPSLAKIFGAVSNVLVAFEPQITAVVKVFGGVVNVVSTVVSAVSSLINPFTAAAGSFTILALSATKFPGLLGGIASALGKLSAFSITGFVARMVTGFTSVGVAATRSAAQVTAAGASMATGALGGKGGIFSKIGSALSGLFGLGSKAGSAAASGAAAGVSQAAGKIGALSGVARAGSAAVGLLGRGLAFLGGPAGIAAAGIATLAPAVSSYVSSVRYAQVDTSKAAKELSNLGRNANLTGTQLDKLLSTGWGPWRDSVSSTAEAVKKFSTTVKAGGSDYINDVKQLDQIIAKMARGGDLAGAKQLYEQFARGVRDSGGSLGMFKADMKETNKAFAELDPNLSKSKNEFYDTAKAVKESSGAMQLFGDAAKNQIKDISQLAEAMKKISDPIIGARNDMRSFYDSVDSFNKLNANGIFGNTSISGNMQNYNNWLREYTRLTTEGSEAQRKAGEAIDKTIGSANQALTTMKNTIPVGSNLAEVNERVAEQSGKYRQKLLEMAQAAGINKEQFGKMLDSMGILSKEDYLARLNSSMNTFTTSVNGAKVQVQQLADGHYVVSVNGNVVDANTTLEQLGFKVRQLTDGRKVVTIHGEDFDASATMGDVKKKLDELGKGVNVPITAPVGSWKYSMQVIENDKKQAEANAPIIAIDGDGRPFKEKANKAKTEINYGSPANIPIDVDKKEFMDKLQRTARYIQASGGAGVQVPVDADTAKFLYKYYGVRAAIKDDGSLVIPINGESDPILKRIKEVNKIGSEAIDKEIILQDGKARADLDAFLKAIGLSSPVIGVQAETSKAQGTIGDLMSDIGNQLANINIGGNPAPAKQSAAETTNWMSALTGYMNIGGNNQPAMATLTSSVNQVNGSYGTMSIFNQKGGGFDNNLFGLKYYVDGTSGSIKVGSQPTPWFYSIANALQGNINSRSGNIGVGAQKSSWFEWVVGGLVNYVNSRQAWITVGATIGASVNNVVSYIRSLSSFADGGIIQQFADGGLSENHTAQIARRGSPIRIWAEPETHGEAYIPLARSKRNRSAKILKETANIMGYNISPRANGSVDKSSSSGDTPQYQFNITQNINTDGNINTDSLARILSRDIANRIS